MKINLLVIFLLSFLITSCSAGPTQDTKIISGLVIVEKPQEEIIHNLPAYYKGTYVSGKSKQAKENLSYKEKGIASWYSDSFHGKRTANGEIYDKNGLTAAHKTLPLPSIVRVTNLDNGKSVIVRVNDRGNFAKGRIIDLSKKAAQNLGFIQKGLVKVEVELIKKGN